MLKYNNNTNNSLTTPQPIQLNILIDSITKFFTKLLENSDNYAIYSQEWLKFQDILRIDPSNESYHQNYINCLETIHHPKKQKLAVCSIEKTPKMYQYSASVNDNTHRASPSADFYNSAEKNHPKLANADPKNINEKLNIITPLKNTKPCQYNCYYSGGQDKENIKINLDFSKAMNTPKSEPNKYVGFEYFDSKPIIKETLILAKMVNTIEGINKLKALIKNNSKDLTNFDEIKQIPVRTTLKRLTVHSKDKKIQEVGSFIEKEVSNNLPGLLNGNIRIHY